MTISYFFAYFSILFLATIIPGPSMLLALNHGANHGIVKTIYSGFGNLIGNLSMALISILGLGIILITSGVVFNSIKWVGVAYLIFIGLKMILEPIEKDAENIVDVQPKSSKKKSRLFLDGFFIAISNPKGIIFFTALFPQFINLNHASASEFMIVFVTLGIVAFGCYMLYGALGFKINSLFQAASFRKFFNRATGSLMIAIGLTIAFLKKIVDQQG